MKRRRVRRSSRVGLRRLTLIVLGTTWMRSPADRPFLLSLALVEENELQRVEVGGQDQQVVDVALAQDAHEVVADLGGQRLRLGEDDPEELLGVFGKKLDPLDGAGRFACQTHGLGRKERRGRRCRSRASPGTP